MESRASVCVDEAVSLPESEADGPLSANRQGSSISDVSMAKFPSNNTSSVDVTITNHEFKRPALLVNDVSPDEVVVGRRRAASDLVDTPTLRLARRDLHSPPPRQRQVAGEETVLYVPDNRRRKRSGSEGAPLLSVPIMHLLPISAHRPDTPPPIWFKSRSVESLIVPDSPPFHPATLTRPVAADSLSPVQIRSPSLARKAAQHGMGINTTDAEDRGQFRRKKSDSLRRSVSASNASLSVMEALRSKRQSDQLLALEVTNHVRQWRKQGQADS
jgi:hypothetical protein